MKKQVYEIDENGYIQEIYVVEFDDSGIPHDRLADDIITVDPPNGLYRAKWTGSEWVEDMTQDEIDELNNQPTLPSQEERIDMLENMILMMMEV